MMVDSSLHNGQLGAGGAPRAYYPAVIAELQFAVVLGWLCAVRKGGAPYYWSCRRNDIAVVKWPGRQCQSRPIVVHGKLGPLCGIHLKFCWVWAKPTFRDVIWHCWDAHAYVIEIGVS